MTSTIGLTNKGCDVAAVNTDFWIATSTIGPVMFLAIGVLAIELVREGSLGWTRT